MQNSLSRKLVLGPFYTFVCASKQAAAESTCPSPLTGTLCLSTGCQVSGFLARLSSLLSGDLWPSFPVTGEVRRAAAVHVVPGSPVPEPYQPYISYQFSYPVRDRRLLNRVRLLGQRLGRTHDIPRPDPCFGMPRCRSNRRRHSATHPLPVSLDRGPLDSTIAMAHCMRAGGRHMSVCSAAWCLPPLDGTEGPTTSSRRNPHRAPDGKTKTFHLIWLSRKKGDQVLPPRQRRTGMMISASVSLLLPLSLRIVATLPFLDLPLPPPPLLGSQSVATAGWAAEEKETGSHPSIHPGPCLSLHAVIVCACATRTDVGWMHARCPSHANARWMRDLSYIHRSDRMTPALGGASCGMDGCLDGLAAGTGWVVEAGEV
jgi:hypothetical protein